MYGVRFLSTLFLLPLTSGLPTTTTTPVRIILPRDVNATVTPSVALANDSALALAPLALTAASCLTLYGITANEGDLCRTVTVLYVRGTIELGNLGTFAGPPFFDFLAAKIGASNLGVQGVPYAASVIGYLEQGDPAGIAMTASMADQIASACPNTQIVLSGYSQGAMTVHLAVPQMAPTTRARVRAAVLFGDPFDGQPMEGIDPSIVDTFCFSLDFICKDTILVDPLHLAYTIDAEPAADFVAGIVSV